MDTLPICSKNLDWKQVNMQGQPVPPGFIRHTGVIHYESPYQTTPVASKTITLQSSNFQVTVNPVSTSFAKGSSTVLTIRSSTLTIFTTRSTTTGTYTVAITGTSGTASHSISAVLMVTS